MPDERREARRARLNGVCATFEGASGERQEADVADIGRGGLFLETDSPLSVGKRLSIEIQVPGESSAWPGLGRVVWSRSHDSGSAYPPGMGVKLIDVDDARSASIDELVLARAPRVAGAAPVPPPEREATIRGVGGHEPVDPVDSSLTIDLIAKKAGEPPAAMATLSSKAGEPPVAMMAMASKSGALADGPIVPTRRRGGRALVAVCVAIVAAIAGYLLLRPQALDRLWP